MGLDSSTNLRAVEGKADETGSDSRQIMGFGISGGEPLNSATTVLIMLERNLIFSKG
jgi:hypothetical protein